MFQARFNEAKHLTLGVGAANLAFTLVAVSANPRANVGDQKYFSYLRYRDSLGWVTLLRNFIVFFFCFSEFFLMERAGRRRLLLAGFISIAMCNLLLTTVESVLVSWSRRQRRRPDTKPEPSREKQSSFKRG